MKPIRSQMHRLLAGGSGLLVLLFSASAPAAVRPWALVGSGVPFEAEYVGMAKGGVTLEGKGGVKKDFAIEKFSPEDQVHLFEMEAGNGRPFSFPKQTSLTTKGGYKAGSLAKPGESVVVLGGGSELHVTEAVSSLAGGFNFTSPDAWLVFDQVPASKVTSDLLDEIRVYGSPAEVGKNVRVAQYGGIGSVVIPHGADFPAMTVFLQKGCAGASMPLKCYEQEGGDRRRDGGIVPAEAWLHGDDRGEEGWHGGEPELCGAGP